MVDGFGEPSDEAAVQAFVTTRESDLFSAGPKARETEGLVMARLRRQS